MMNNFRNEMIYGIDFSSYGVPGNPQSALPQEYSQAPLSHLHQKFAPTDSNPGPHNLDQAGPMNSFHPNGMDELYNLLINASEREFPIEMGSGSVPQKISSKDKKSPSESRAESIGQSETKNKNSRKRRLPSSSSNPTPSPSSNNSNNNNSQSNSNLDSSDEANPENGEEKDEINDSQAKRTRRLVKNREAAQLFRQRQKAYIGDLEQKVDKLSTENVALQSKVDLLSAENKLIKEQLGYLRNFISQVTMTLPFPYNQQAMPRETAFSRKVGFDPKYQWSPLCVQRVGSFSAYK